MKLREVTIWVVKKREEEKTVLRETSAFGKKEREEQVEPSSSLLCIFLLQF